MSGKSKLRKTTAKRNRRESAAFSELQKARKEITRLRTQVSTPSAEAKRCRQEVGQKLHDGICQELSSVALYVQSLRNQMDRGNNARVPELMDLLSRAVNKVVDSTHALSRQLVGDGPEAAGGLPGDPPHGSGGSQ